MQDLLYVYIFMFLKQERPEMDDFERKNNLVVKKISSENFQYKKNNWKPV